jgi:hypothetical protein
VSALNGRRPKPAVLYPRVQHASAGCLVTQRGCELSYRRGKQPHPPGSELRARRRHLSKAQARDASRVSCPRSNVTSSCLRVRRCRRRRRCRFARIVASRPPVPPFGARRRALGLDEAPHREHTVQRPLDCMFRPFSISHQILVIWRELNRAATMRGAMRCLRWSA